MAYCTLFLIARLIQKLVFGELRVSEQQVNTQYMLVQMKYRMLYFFSLIGN